MAYYTWQSKVVGKLEMKNTSPKKTSDQEIIIEIENGLKHTDQATLITLLAALKNGFDARKPSPFDWLPDEMIMKIIRMTINDLGDQRHNHLVGNIAKISRRFKNLAADKTLNQSVPVTQQSGQNTGARIIYTFPSTKEKETFPYMIKVDQYHLTLKDVKDRCPRKGQQYRYFFKTAFEGYEVFEEIHDDAAAVPMFNGLKIVVECRGSNC